MEKLNVILENCFGIKSLKYEFDFSHDNVVAIYARNGLMKTSFSKTFKKIQEGKVVEVKDEIFDLPGNVVITRDGQEVLPEDIFVIRSLEPLYTSNSINALLLNDSIRAKIDGVLKLKDKLLKELVKYSGLKITKITGGENVYELETKIVQDFGFEEDSFLMNLKALALQTTKYNCAHIKYNSIFDPTVINKIRQHNFQAKIKDFLRKSDEVYDQYSFLKKGEFTLPRLKDIQKTLKDSNFFVNDNYIMLAGLSEIDSLEKLEDIIEGIEKELKEVPEFKEIEKLLSDAKGKVLKEVIERNPELVGYLVVEKLDELKKSLWISYIQSERIQFTTLLTEYEKLEEELSKVNLDDTLWRKAVDIFKERFDVPYEMEISNLKGAIIGESIPKIEFHFKNEQNDNAVRMDRKKLEELDILSQGERRALYLLNIIFDIEKVKSTKKETILIVDDIADSFDYKNKYAIIEYLYEMAQNDKFYLIILTHNFDFYRTVCSRLNITDDRNKLNVEVQGDALVLQAKQYDKQPFDKWKKDLSVQNILALIPFVRNIIQYGKDKKICETCQIKEFKKDRELLTQLLHQKDKTDTITFGDLIHLYKEYLGKDTFTTDVDLNRSIIQSLYEIADSINENNADLQYKIILSMAIRHKAEKLMIEAIEESPNEFTWRWQGRVKHGTANECMNHIRNTSNQTRELFSAYKQIGDTTLIKNLEEVNIMTPENIHLNSFMYEPILDMDIKALINLYKTLC